MNMHLKKYSKEPSPFHDHTRGSVRALVLLCLSLVLALIVESLSRASVPETVIYVLEHPAYFGYNCLIILTTLVFSELFKHRRAVLFLASVLWLGLGIAALCVVNARTQPFASLDILMMKDFIKLTTLYYTWPQIIAIFAGIFTVLMIIILIVTKLPKRKSVNYTLSLLIFSGLATLCVCIYTLGVSSGAYPKHFENLVTAYDAYGFPACFAFTFGGMGVGKPSDYSTETVTDIVEEIDAPEPTETLRAFGEDDNLAQPNIIYVQLESLFDVNTVIGAEFSEDPTPNFNTLSRNYPSGLLSVAHIGGGTANVEFEVLTGMNLDFFGVAEYPYSTVLQNSTCESIAYNLRDLGYATTALHNHTATFYSRNDVYSRLGFEHFVSLEYMPYVTYTDVGWAEDMVLSDEIIKALRATEQRDFIMTVTVESHGKYDGNLAYYDGDPEILALPENIDRGQFASYVHLIRQTDLFIDQLIRELEAFDEPVVCVFYGDHLPSLGLTADLLTTHDLYQSRYIIWNNFSADFSAPDLQAYRLSAHLLGELDMPSGIIAKFHQSYDPECNDSEYLEKLEMLQYDLLYGDQSVYGGQSPYAPTELVMGSVPIVIDSVSNLYGRVLVSGANFTEYSRIEINGLLYPTAFISDQQIVAIVPRTTTVSQVSVVQIATDGTELSRTGIHSPDNPV